MSDEKVVIRSYRWKDAKPSSHLYGSYSNSEPEKAEDHAGIFRDLWLRVDTLNDAKRAVLLSLDTEHLHLSTLVPASPPNTTVAPAIAPRPAKKSSRRASSRHPRPDSTR